jgi:hypothetical protein
MRDEAEVLRRIGRWRSATFVMWAMTLPVGFAALYAWPDGVFAVAAFWFALIVFVGIKGRGPCPRWKQRFPVQERGMNPWEKGCMNCGLRTAPKGVRR